MDSHMHDLDVEVDKIIRAVADRYKRNPSSWPTWKMVAKVGFGSEEEADRLAAIAELPDYRHLFVQLRDKGRVKPSEDAFHRLETIGKHVAVTGDGPDAVAAAVRQYASSLSRIHVRVEDVRPVRHTGSKCVQAIFLEMDDAHLQHGTPVEFRPSNGGSRTHGTIVGQNEDDGCVFVAMDTAVGRDDLPAHLSLDRAFMLTRLAQSIEATGTVPALIVPLTMAHEGAAVDAPNAVLAAHELAHAVRPWTRLLWGPPGAGKTFAIARLVTQFLKEDPTMTLLLTAPSNLSADVLVEELVSSLEAAGLKGMLTERRLLRYGYPEKSSVLEREELLGPVGAAEAAGRVRACARKLAAAERKRSEEDKLAVLRAELLQAQQALKGMVRDHVQNVSVVVTSTHLAFLPDSPVSQKRWSIVVVDEATMVPPAVCYFLGSLADEAFLLAGDPRQLGPVTEADRGLSEAAWRWMGTDVFEFAGVAQGQGQQRIIDDQHPLLLRITEQRRCSKQIWQVIKHAYPGIACHPASSTHGIGTGLDPSPENDVALLDTGPTNQTRCSPHKKSWRNLSSAELALEVASALLGDCPEATIAIITPFRAQAALLKKMWRSERNVSESFDRVQVAPSTSFKAAPPTS